VGDSVGETDSDRPAHTSSGLADVFSLELGQGLQVKQHL
jgi:hypothetical protein